VVIPEIDKYRFEKICSGAGKTVSGTISSTTAYDEFLAGVSELIENNVPTADSVAFVSSNVYRNIKEDSSFIRNGDLSQKMLIKGQVGTIDGIPVIVVPKSYFPEGVEFIITNQAATVSPVKLSEYKIHDNPPGINGWLIEGRVYYDAFVLGNKSDAIYVFKSGSADD
jgi:N4-gp56 family major capsid protein